MMDKLKYGLLKVINITGLTFLDPVVRLIWGEEPGVQAKLIGRFIVVPVVGILVFVGAWAYLAPKHKTKSGEVPTPAVTWDAAKDIWRFHRTEGDKELAYVTAGEDAAAAAEATRARLAEIEPLTDRAKQQVDEARAAAADRVAAIVGPVQAEYDALKGELDVAKKDGVAALKARGAEVTPQTRSAYLAEVAAFEAAQDASKERLDQLGDELDEAKATATPGVKAALRAQTLLAEERQYLEKKLAILTSEGRGPRTESAAGGVAKAREAFEQAEGDQVYAAARKVLRAEEREAKVAESTYAKPYTLPMQIKRSVLCVFFGFFLGTSIAIPIGVLCGLSPTFMAVMTPFIALFKPVSPIVWLPIALIVVGGFIPDPDTNPLIQWLWELPLIGEYKINPAFIASGITVALCSLWATMTNTALGVASIDKDHLNVARVLQLGFFSRLFKIILPSALPLIFAGLRISLGVGWMVLIAAELLSSSEGIGKFVWDQFNNGASDSFAKMFVVVFVVGAIGLLLDRIMIVLQRAVSFEGSVAAI